MNESSELYLVSVPGMPISPDPILHEQRALNEFCFRHPGFDRLCDVSSRRNPLLSLPLKPPRKGELAAFRALQASPALNAPIVVIGRRNPARFADTLKTLLYQVGLKTSNVFVLAPPGNASLYVDLAAVFGFHAVRGKHTQLTGEWCISFARLLVHLNLRQIFFVKM